jgi:hypothetical protein
VRSHVSESRVRCFGVDALTGTFGIGIRTAHGGQTEVSARCGIGRGWDGSATNVLEDTLTMHRYGMLFRVAPTPSDRASISIKSRRFFSRKMDARASLIQLNQILRPEWKSASNVYMCWPSPERAPNKFPIGEHPHSADVGI